MDYAEAKKSIQARKPKENFMVIHINHEIKIILPYKDGLTLVSALSNAEQLKEAWSEPARIYPIDREAICTFIMSPEEYERIKIATLLNISVDDVKQYEAEK